MSIKKNKQLSLRMPIVEGHPNRVPFEGCLTLIDIPSDKPPYGARGHRIVIPYDTAAIAMPSLLGMAIDYHECWDNHNVKQKCGIITSAKLTKQKILVKGFIYARDYPEVSLCKHDLGMSFMVANAHVADIKSSIWSLAKLTFTGASILIRSKCAYNKTSFNIVKTEESGSLAGTE